MSKLDELIKELCPNGVEYKYLGEIGQVKMCKRILKSQTNANVGIPFYKIGTFGGKASAFISEELFKEYKERYPYPKVGEILISAAGTVGRTVIYNGEPAYYQDSNIVWLSHDESKILNTYLMYCYELKPWNISSGGTIARLYNDDILKAKIPVPPLEVQCEIVRILDSFTLLTAELIAELKAELTARKKQYEYYRNELLKPKKTIPLVTLKEIATSIYRGSGIKREQITESGIPCVRYGEIYTTYNTWFDKCVSRTKEEYVSNPKYFEHGDILFAITGESVEDIAKSIAYVGNEKCMAGGDIVVMKHQQNPRYLSHVLNTSFAREQKSKGKVKSKVVHSNVPSIEQIKIPLPSLEVQKRYADVLDNFEQICNDLNIGLPAEIEARKKQYEYYRDLLLTFAETGKIIATDRQTDRQTVIKLVQYVFGYVPVKLSDIATIVRGGNFQKKDFVASGRPCIHYGQMYTYFGVYTDKTLTFVNNEVFNKSKIAQKGDIVMAVTSENVEDVCSCTAWLGNEEIAISGHTAIISHNQNAKYLSYFFHSNSFFEQKKRLAHGTKVIEVTPSKLGNIEIMLPPLEEQERIVSILDRFDSLCNEISTGLPAEIEARKKQYEYYRDKLLSFE